MTGTVPNNVWEKRLRQPKPASGEKVPRGWDGAWLDVRESVKPHRVVVAEPLWDASGVCNTMVYNADSQRVEKDDSTGTTKFVWDQQQILEETDQNNVPQVEYTNEPAGYGNLVSRSLGGSSQWYHFDGLGSVDRVTSSLGVVIGNYVYDGFGGGRGGVGVSGNKHQYVGRVGYYFDSDTCLYQLRARPYRPSIARFMMVDPLNFASADPNFYRYVHGDPISRADPSGLFEPTATTAAIVIIGGILIITTTSGCIPATPPVGVTGVKDVDNELGVCGRFNHTFRWALSAVPKPAGVIIQAVQRRFKVFSCDPPSKQLERDELAVGFIQASQRADFDMDHYEALAVDDDRPQSEFDGWSSVKFKCTMGTIEYSAVARYYSDITYAAVERKWSATSVSGSIPSSPTPLAGHDPVSTRLLPGASVHSFKVWWNCCDKAKETGPTEVTPTPS